MIPWTETRTAELVELWRLKRTVSEIADHFDIERGAVSGKLHRMGLLGEYRPERRTKKSERKPIVQVTTGSWDEKLFEPYAHRKIRLAHEREMANVR